jgi:low temperature requirement protein LtrA
MPNHDAELPASPATESPERHASWLELFFDLAAVVAWQVAHGLVRHARAEDA